MAKLIQVELTREEGSAKRHLVTWMPADLKPKVGEAFTDGKTVWNAAQVYTLIPEERECGSPWKRR